MLLLRTQTKCCVLKLEASSGWLVRALVFCAFLQQIKYFRHCLNRRRFENSLVLPSIRGSVPCCLPVTACTWAVQSARVAQWSEHTVEDGVVAASWGAANDPRFLVFTALGNPRF